MVHFAVTANTTRGGQIVYLRFDGGKTAWTESLAEAAIAATEAEAQAWLKLADADVKATLVGNVYVFDLELAGDGSRRHLSAKERVRAEGPSIPYGRGPKVDAGLLKGARRP